MGIPATLERDAAELRATITNLRQEADTKQAAAEELVKEEKAAGRNPLAGTTDDDRESFKRIDAAYKEADTPRQTAAELEARLHAMLDHVGADARTRADGDPGHPAIARAMSLGRIAATHEHYEEFLASGQLDRAEGKVFFRSIEVANKAQAKAILAGGRPGAVFADAGDGTPLVPSDERLIPPVEIPKRVPTLLDLINVSGTSRDAVTWSKMVSRDTAATTTVPFGTALNKSRYTYTTVTSPAIRKGHYAVVDEGNIADQEEFQGIIDGELISDLRLIVERDALHAAGGSDWTGIYNSPIGDYDATEAANRADALHRAITTVRVALEREPTAWGISPEDFEDYYLTKGKDGHYLHHRGPQEAQVTSIWGKPAMVSTGYTKPIVAEWRVGATLWVREGISIAVDRIDDQFLEGLWTIRAQTRGAFAVKQPLAFCQVENFEDLS